MHATVLTLGDRTFDIGDRALVMGILNRTPDSFYDKGATYALDDLLRRAERLVDDGADLLDVGGVKAGPGPGGRRGRGARPGHPGHRGPARPASTSRCRSTPGGRRWPGEAYAAGAVVGNDISGFADPEYLPAAAAAGATVVATHIRLGPRIPDPEPVYDDVVEAVAAFLVERASLGPGRRASPPTGSSLDAGLDLGKTAEQSLTLLRASDRLAGLGYPLLLSASNKTFLGEVLDLEIDERSAASLAATALGAAARVPDHAGPRRGRPPPGVLGDGRRQRRPAVAVGPAAPREGRPVSAAEAAEPTHGAPGRGRRGRSTWSRATTPRWWPRPPTPCSSSWWAAATRR